MQQRGESQQASHGVLKAIIESDAAHAGKLGKRVYTYALYLSQIGSATDFKCNMFLFHYFLYLIRSHTCIATYYLQLISILATTNFCSRLVLLLLLLVLVLLLLHMLQDGVVADATACNDFLTYICACW
jgi:hypothetical protein